MVDKTSEKNFKRDPIISILSLSLGMSGTFFFTICGGFAILFFQLWVNSDTPPIIITCFSFMGAYLGGKLYEIFFIIYLSPFILEHFGGGDAT